jgi:hypothetical protein
MIDAAKRTAWLQNMSDATHDFDPFANSLINISFPKLLASGGGGEKCFGHTIFH